jgi:hypothetical protein
LQFLKDKGIATDEELVPYLEQAATASNVKWRAGRLRIKHLLASAMRSTEEEKASTESKEAASEEKGEKPSEESAEAIDKKAENITDRSQEKPAELTSRSEEAGPAAPQSEKRAEGSEEREGKDAG